MNIKHLKELQRTECKYQKAWIMYINNNLTSKKIIEDKVIVEKN